MSAALRAPQNKKQQIDRVLRGELTLAELTQELDVSPSVVRKWKRLFEHGSEVAVEANGHVVPAPQLREAERRIHELERALGTKTMEPQDPPGRPGGGKKRPP